MEDRRGQRSVLGKEWQISGELSIANDAVIEGQINGVLRSQGTLELGESAKVSGTVIGENIRVAGQIEADVVAEQEVELLPGAKMRGRVFSHRFCVNEGAGFRGEIWIDQDAMEVAQQEVLSKVGSTPQSVTRDNGPRNGEAGELTSGELAMLTSDHPDRRDRPVRTRPQMGNGAHSHSGR